MLSRVASWHHGSAVWPIFTPMRSRSSSRLLSVILGELRWAFMSMVVSPGGVVRKGAGNGKGKKGLGGQGLCGGVLTLAQHLAVDLACGGFGQFGNKGHMARGIEP